MKFLFYQALVCLAALASAAPASDIDANANPAAREVLERRVDRCTILQDDVLCRAKPHLNGVARQTFNKGARLPFQCSKDGEAEHRVR